MGKMGRGIFAPPTFFNRFQPFLNYMSFNLSSSAAVNKEFMDIKLGGRNRIRIP